MSLFLRDESEDEDLVIELSNLSRNEESENTSEGIIRESEEKSSGNEVINNGDAIDTDKNNEEKVLYPLVPVDPKTGTLKPNIEEIRPVDVQVSLPLPFQHLILENMLVSENALLVIGKGLSVLLIVTNLLYTLCTPTRINGQDKRSLVLLLNATSEDEAIISEELMELQWSCNEDDEQGKPGAVPSPLFPVIHLLWTRGPKDTSMGE